MVSGDSGFGGVAAAISAAGGLVAVEASLFGASAAGAFCATGLAEGFSDGLAVASSSESSESSEAAGASAGAAEAAVVRRPLASTSAAQKPSVTGLINMLVPTGRDSCSDPFSKCTQGNRLDVRD